MIIKKNTLFSAMIIVLIIGGYFVFAQGSTINGNVIGNYDNAQVVKLRVEGSQYIFEPSEVKKGPIRIEGDIARMPGCSKSIIASGLGISKTLTTTNNLIEFTPDKSGAYNFACSMNMYQGTLIILESDGTKGTYVEAANTAGSTCGSSGGGCGCGG